MNHSETDLLSQTASGSHEAFERFYRRHLDQVLGYAAKRCRNAQEVTEVTAAVFVAVWAKAHTFDASRGTEAAWLNGIAARALIDLRRAEARTSALRQRIIDQRVLRPEDEERIAARIDAAQRSGTLAAAIARLPAAQRDVVTLVVLDELSSAEAAQILGTSATAVRMRLSRAKRSLRATKRAMVIDSQERRTRTAAAFGCWRPPRRSRSSPAACCGGSPPRT